MPQATVAIVTRNRRLVAAKAIESALAQAGDVEVIVFDDASTDGTAELIRDQFPQVRLERAEVSKGVRFARNRTVELATSPIVFSIDDDAVFEHAEVVRQVVTTFDDPHIGAVAIPHENHFSDGRVETWWPPLPDPDKAWVVPTFVGTAYAVRREAFLKIGGYQIALTHWGEEQDLCQRMYGAGLVVRLSPFGRVCHFPEGVGKYDRKSNRHISCNALSTVWMNAPARYVAPISAALIARFAVQIVRRQTSAPPVLEGLAMWLGKLPQSLRLRQAISVTRYRTWLDVRKRRLAEMASVIRRLNPSDTQSVPSKPASPA